MQTLINNGFPTILMMRKPIIKSLTQQNKHSNTSPSQLVYMKRG